MKALILQLLASLADSIRDLLPIVAVIAFFQLVVLGQPIPNLWDMLWGMLLVLLGLALFYALAAGLGAPRARRVAGDLAILAGLGLALLTLFALGLFLGHISKDNILLYGLKTIVAGIASILIEQAVQEISGTSGESRPPARIRELMLERAALPLTMSTVK